MMPNLLQYPIAVFGAMRAGLIVVNTNPLYTERELEHQLKDSGAKAIVVLANMAHMVEKVIKNTDVSTGIVTQVGDMLPTPKRIIVNAAVKYIKKMVPRYSIPKVVSFRKALKLGRKKAPIEIRREHDEVAILQYTGGTTGVAKGAMLTHRNMLSNMFQIKALVG